MYQNLPQQAMRYDRYRLRPGQWALLTLTGLGICAAIAYTFYRSLAAFAVLADHSEGNLLEWTVKSLQTERPRLAEKLEELGFIVYPSQTNYLLFRSPDEDSRDYKQGCLEHGILIRACENFEGLNRHYYRVAVRNRGENERLINILKEVQSEEKHNVNL